MLLILLSVLGLTAHAAEKACLSDAYKETKLQEERVNNIEHYLELAMKHGSLPCMADESCKSKGDASSSCDEGVCQCSEGFTNAQSLGICQKKSDQPEPEPQPEVDNSPVTDGLKLQLFADSIAMKPGGETSDALALHLPGEHAGKFARIDRYQFPDTANFAIEGWINVKTKDNDKYMFSFDSAGGNCILVNVNVPDANKWYHWTLNVDAEGNMKNYLDGEQHQEMIEEDNEAFCEMREGIVVLGQDQDLPGGGFDGEQAPNMMYDSIRVYKGTLSTWEMKQIATGKRCLARDPWSNWAMSNPDNMGIDYSDMRQDMTTFNLEAKVGGVTSCLFNGPKVMQWSDSFESGVSFIPDRCKAPTLEKAAWMHTQTVVRFGQGGPTCLRSVKDITVPKTYTMIMVADWNALNGEDDDELDRTEVIAAQDDLKYWKMALSGKDNNFLVQAVDGDKPVAQISLGKPLIIVARNSGEKTSIWTYDLQGDGLDKVEEDTEAIPDGSERLGLGQSMNPAKIDEYMRGDMAAFLMYDKVLSDEDTTDVVAFLRAKYVKQVLQYRFSTWTSEATHAETVGEVVVSFMVNGEWTADRSFFEGVEKGDYSTKLFTMDAYPTQIKLTLKSTNGWGFWRIKLAGVVIKLDPNGKEGRAYGDNGYWLDGDQEAPASLTFDVPADVGVRWLVVGHKDDNKCMDPMGCDSRIEPMNQVHPFRCCSDESITGWKKNDGCDIWHKSKWGDDDECHEMKFAEAEYFCWSQGGRLCLRSEVEDQCVHDSGCGYDWKMLWTANARGPRKPEGGAFAFKDANDIHVYLAPIDAEKQGTDKVCKATVIDTCLAVGMNSVCHMTGDDAPSSSGNPKCVSVANAPNKNVNWFRYHYGEEGCSEGEDQKYKCDIWGAKNGDDYPEGPTFVASEASRDGNCGVCGINGSASWCYHGSLVDKVGYAVCAAKGAVPLPDDYPTEGEFTEKSFCSASSSTSDTIWMNSLDDCFASCDKDKDVCYCTYNCGMRQYAMSPECEIFSSTCGSFIVKTER